MYYHKNLKKRIEIGLDNELRVTTKISLRSGESLDIYNRRTADEI